MAQWPDPSLGFGVDIEDFRKPVQNPQKNISISVCVF